MEADFTNRHKNSLEEQRGRDTMSCQNYYEQGEEEEEEKKLKWMKRTFSHEHSHCEESVEKAILTML